MYIPELPLTNYNTFLKALLMVLHDCGVNNCGNHDKHWELETFC